MKHYKECVEQIVSMLRAYKKEPDEFLEEISELCIPELNVDEEEQLHFAMQRIQQKMADTVFLEMLQYIPAFEDREYIIEQYEKDR